MAKRDACYEKCKELNLITRKKTWANMDITVKKKVWQIFNKELGWNPQGTDKRVNIYINEIRKKWKKEELARREDPVHNTLAHTL